MSYSACFQGWLATTNLHQVLYSLVEYFVLSLYSSLLPVSRYPVWEGHGRMVLKRILNVLVCPKKRMHRSGTDGDGESRLTQVHLEGSPGRITQVHLEGSPGRITQVHLEGSPGRITQVHLEGWSYKKDGYRQWNVRQFLQSA